MISSLSGGICLSCIRREREREGFDFSDGCRGLQAGRSSGPTCITPALLSYFLITVNSTTRFGTFMGQRASWLHIRFLHIVSTNSESPDFFTTAVFSLNPPLSSCGHSVNGGVRMWVVWWLSVCGGFFLRTGVFVCLCYSPIVHCCAVGRCKCWCRGEDVIPFTRWKCNSSKHKKATARGIFHTLFIWMKTVFRGLNVRF